ncbi:MAG: hypothetical protein Q7S42_05555 [Candidatus Omnitrophota bacterium]|nr:hypothetical protein [Candidatus Omnitrophota bacterium]
MKKLAVVIFILVLGVMVAPIVCQAETKKEVTYDQEKDWYQDFFAKHLLESERIDAKVKMVSDGFFGIRDDESGSIASTFILPVEGTFSGPLDHHAHSKFTIKNIEPDGVTIQYESRFDHRSFGNDLISTDIGTVKIKYKAK